MQADHPLLVAYEQAVASVQHSSPARVTHDVFADRLKAARAALNAALQVAEPQSPAPAVEVDLEGLENFVGVWRRVVALQHQHSMVANANTMIRAVGYIDALLSEVRALRGANEAYSEALCNIRDNSNGWQRDTANDALKAAEAELSALRSLVEGKYSEVSQGSGDAASSRAFGRGKAQGEHTWPRAGDRMRFLGRNGYPYQLTEALAVFSPGETLTVHNCDVDSFSHTIQFKEHPGRRWNGVMFEPAHEAQGGEP